MTGTGVRVLIVDDHQMVRAGLAAILDAAPNMEVVGQAGTAADAVDEAHRTRPDVVLLDVRLPDGSGIDVCREVRSSNNPPAVLMITSYDAREAQVQATLAGAAGFFLKDIDTDALVDSIRRVARGEILLDRQAARRELRSRAKQPGLDSLSPQERRVLNLIGEGLTNRQIAERLFLSEKTVKHYVTTLLSKLDMQRRTQAAVFITHLQEQGLGPGTEPTR